jgi:hypothetical protein
LSSRKLPIDFDYDDIEERSETPDKLRDAEKGKLSENRFIDFLPRLWRRSIYNSNFPHADTSTKHESPPNDFTHRQPIVASFLRMYSPSMENTKTETEIKSN